MKRTLLPFVGICMGLNVCAQQDIYALTGKSSPQIVFNDFRSLDVKTGTSGEIFLNAEAKMKVFSQNLNTELTESRASLHHAQTPSMAALAYDAAGSDLIFAPMFSSNIYVLDTRTRQVTLVENNVIKTTTCDLGSHITRMTTGYDGNIYALTNSGSQLIQISKRNNKYTVTDLGKIRDISSDPKVSLQVTQAGFGGDMVADAKGDFYVFAASGNVFKVTLNNLTSEFVGKIAGLPEQYSLNGAAVNAEGNVVVASAKGEGFFEVNMETLKARTLNYGVNLHIYDLASRYFTHESHRVSAELAYDGIEIYPTKVNRDELYVRIADKLLSGQAMVELYNSAGTKVLSKSLNAKERSVEHAVDLSNIPAGMYLVNVSDLSGKTLTSKKILVE